MDYKGATSPLEQWVALEVRKAKALLRQKKAEQDAWFEENKVPKSGTRIIKLEQALSDLSVSLTTAIHEKSVALVASEEALNGARQQAQDFLKYGSDMLLAVESYLSSFLPGDSSALNKSTLKMIEQLVADVDGAFESFLFAQYCASRPVFPDTVAMFFYDEALRRVSSQHDEIEVRNIRAGRNGDYYLREMANAASDEVIDFVTKVISRPVKCDSVWLRSMALQMHSDMFERVAKIPRHDQWGEIDSEELAILSRCQKEAWKRIDGCLDAQASTEESRLFTLWKKLPLDHIFQGKFGPVLDTMLAGLRDQTFASVNHAATMCAHKAQICTHTGAKADSLIQMLNKEFKKSIRSTLSN